MNLDELKALAEGATPGARTVISDDNFIAVGDPTEDRGYTILCHMPGSVRNEEIMADAAFIAAANPAVVLALVEVARAAKAWDEASEGAAKQLFMTTGVSSREWSERKIGAEQALERALSKLESL